MEKRGLRRLMLGLVQNKIEKEEIISVLGEVVCMLFEREVHFSRTCQSWICSLIFISLLYMDKCTPINNRLDSPSNEQNAPVLFTKWEPNLPFSSNLLYTYPT
jgi:hypothetical protein